MTFGLKNLQSVSRACSRRERLESGDSGIGLLDESEAGYISDDGLFERNPSPEREDVSAGYTGSYRGRNKQMSDGRSIYDSRDGSMRGESMGRGYAQGSIEMQGIGLQKPQSTTRLPFIDTGVGSILNRGV